MMFFFFYWPILLFLAPSTSVAQDYLADFKKLAQKTEEFSTHGRRVITRYEQSQLLYLHRGHDVAVNDWFYQYFELAQDIRLLGQQFAEDFPDEGEWYNYFVAHLQAYLLGNFLLLVAGNYDIYRYLEEGDLYGKYGEKSFRKLTKKYVFLQERFQGYPPPIVGKWPELADELQEMVERWPWLNFTQWKKIMLAQDLPPVPFLMNVAGKVVQVFTEILSKRDTSISLRFWTNFRKNYLRTNLRQVEQIIIRELSLHPGDILAEKDLQANTDLVIPGYWGHNGVYLGTIDFFRQINIWDHDSLKKIREFILSYRYDRDKRSMMKQLDLFSIDFEQIHWVLEANRDGVKVIPLRRFLLVDGLALLRANRFWKFADYKDLLFRANYFMGKAYDHTHDVRNKRGMTCSKFIGYLFSDITFPVKQYREYLIMGPDQIVSTINRNFSARQEGNLKLLAFFDAADRGRLKYHYHFLDTPEGYQKFLATLPPVE